ncbi:MAG: V-type ATP synthase subunit E [Erysipelotrichaceae bacterium]
MVMSVKQLALNFEVKAMERNYRIEDVFDQEINNVSGKEEEAILKEVEDIKKNALNEIQDEAKANAEMMMEQELSEIRSDSAIAMSRISSTNNKKIIAKREEYADKIFSEAKNRLMAFVKSKEYKNYIQKKISEVQANMNCEHCCIYVSEDDLALKQEFEVLLKLDCTLKASKDIHIGGFRLENREKGIVMDETLDNALDNQRTWFYDHSQMSVDLDD